MRAFCTCVENDTLKGEKYTLTALDLMTPVQTIIDGTQGGTGKQKRQSYKLEKKLEVITFYHSSNLYKTSREVSLNTRTILRWVKDEQKIRGSKKGSRHAVFQRSALFPDMEE